MGVNLLGSSWEEEDATRQQGGQCILKVIIILQKQQQMQLLELDCPVQEPTTAEVGELLHLVLEAQGFNRVYARPNFHAPLATYNGSLFLPRAQACVKVRWGWKVTGGSARVQLGLEARSAAGSVCDFLVEVGDEIQEFVSLLNNLSLCDREGYFIFKQLTGQLILRYKIHRTRFLNNRLSRSRYLSRTLTAITNLFVEHLEQIIFYYKLPGLCLGELQGHLQNQNHVPLRQETDNIIYLQNLFEAQRMERKGTTKQQFRANYQFPLQIYTDFLFNSSPEMRGQQICKMQFEQRLQSIQSVFKYELQTLLHDLSHRKKKSSQLILTSIKIKGKAKESIIGTGGYAEIIYGIYSYVPQISIYGNVAPHQSPLSNEDEPVMKNCSLVKKIGLNGGEGDVNISLENECNFLKYIRNKVCPYIAKYFCNSEVEYPFSDKEIYLEYYPNNLGECRINESRKMKVIEDVCMALLFLSQQSLIHRDLKEVNIMVDRYHRGRLIDFGSVSNVNGSSKFKAKDEKVRSTVGYYLPYKDAVTTCPSLEMQMSRNQYYSHETFDLYGLGRVIENEFYLRQLSGRSHFLRHNLMLLSQKCREVNPQDRWTIQQVIIFLRHLITFSQLRRQFWKFGFDPRFRAHELGKTYNGNGGYQMRQEEVVFGRQMLRK